MSETLHTVAFVPNPLMFPQGEKDVSTMATTPWLGINFSVHFRVFQRLEGVLSIIILGWVIMLIM